MSISFAEDSSSTYASLVRGRRGPEGSSRSGVSFSEQTYSRDVQIDVQGDLSAEERNDIQDLVRQVTQALRSFEHGDGDAAAGSLATRGDLDSLSGFHLEMHHEESLSVAIQSRRNVGTLPQVPVTPVTPVAIERAAKKPAAQPVPIAPPVEESPAQPIGTEELATNPLTAAGVSGTADPIVDVLERALAA